MQKTFKLIDACPHFSSLFVANFHRKIGQAVGRENYWKNVVKDDNNALWREVGMNCAVPLILYLYIVVSTVS